MKLLRLYLASASPRRLELLRQAGFDPIVVPGRLEEDGRRGETPGEHVRRLAEAKGRAVAASREWADPGVILAADTAVAIDGTILGKPPDAAAAGTMLRQLRGKPHHVWTGVFLLRTDDRRSVTESEATRVFFRPYDDATIGAYVATGEPLDKAGAYAIQGRGALLAERIEGSWSNVVGLPLERLPEWMRRIDVPLERLLDW